MAECETGDIDVLEALLERDDSYPPWGFELRGGTDFRQPLSITRVAPRSPAARIGLRAGDVITEIGDLESSNLTQQDALDALAQYGLSLILTVERKATGRIPTNPVLHGSADAEPMKSYQTYNMCGGQQRPISKQPFYRSPTSSTSPADSRRSFSPTFTYPACQPQQQALRPSSYQTYNLNGPTAPQPTRPQHDYRFETVKAQPFQVPQNKSMSSTYRSPPQTYQPAPTTDYDQPDSPGGHQSRTFKLLQGLMENDDEPPPCGLTPGYSSGNHGDQPPAPPIVHKQYNTPITLYSQQSVSESVTVDGLSLTGDDNNDDEPKPYLNSSVMQMVKEMDEEDTRVKTGKATKYNALGHRKQETNIAENPFTQASVSYKAYARKFAPFGGSTAIDDARELRQRNEQQQERASQSDFYSSSVEPRNADSIVQSDEFNRDALVESDVATPQGAGSIQTIS